MVFRIQYCNLKKLHINICTNNNRTLFSTRYCTWQVPIASGYKPREIESNKYLKWERKKEHSINSQKPKFSLILPPPNVTGNLHLGHALMCTIGDVLCRQKEQQGFDVVWVPGTDHAGISTQVIVEKTLLKQKNLSRHQIGQEAFLNEIWKWKREKEGNIKKNLKKLGCSLNWDMEYFTMDHNQEKAVQQAFIRLFDEGLIKRKKSLINWSCALESAISDIEVENQEIKGPTLIPVPGYDQGVTFGKLYDIAYKICEADDEIVVSTTRPETLLGDVAIAVHPDDHRYNKFNGNNIQAWHPFREEPIPIVFDDSVDREFGTGAVKITPAHDKCDYEIAQRHALPTIPVFTEKGLINENFKDFANLPRFNAREKILEALDSLNLLRGTKSHSMNLPMCSRSNDVIEYMLRPQWFLQCREMADIAMSVVKEGNIKIIPSNYETDWMRWLSDCKDWCISRQLWWGHPIPAYLCTFKEHSLWVAATSKEEALEKAKNKFKTSTEEITVNPESDVLDTWFSASLLPFSVFSWPDNNYMSMYPLDIMVTGHDILFFWVARMVMMGQKLTGEVPFRNVLLNGIICDAHGRKMSKSIGNVVLPEQVIYGASLEELTQEVQRSHDAGMLPSGELKKSVSGIQKMFPNGIPECGTDALRLTLCSHNIKSHFINFDVSECYTNKLFLNKIWQATRFTLNSSHKLQMNSSEMSLNNIELCDMDRWILSRLANTKKICNQSFESYNLHIAVSALKTFFYSNLCDVYLETTKPAIFEGSDKGKGHCSVLSACLSIGLQTMAPFTPFISEELLEYFPQFSDLVCTSFSNKNIEEEVDQILYVCLVVRQLKSQNQITKKHEPKVHIFPENNSALKLLFKYKDEIKVLSFSHEVILENNSNHKRKNQFNLMSTAGHLCSFGITTNDKFSSGQPSKAVLNMKKFEKLQKELNKLLKTISSEGYKKSANETVQRKHLEKVKQLETEISNIKGLS